jgi:hypothetical protein
MSRLEATQTRPTEPPATTQGPKSRLLVAWLGVLVLAATAVVGSNMFAVRDHVFGTATPNAAAPAVGRSAGAGDATQTTVAAAPTSLRSQPWWQDVTVLEGTGTSTSAPFTIASGALQWRVTWSCPSGRIQVRAPKQTRPVVDGACTTGGVGYSASSGPLTVAVTADGPWRLEVAQEIDSALVEPPSAAMTAPGAAALASGAFYNIDKTGTGKVTLYRQADGRYALRLEDFFVSPTADLELRLSTAEAPRSTPDYLASRNELVVRMDVTAGSLNYPVPAGIDPTKFKSVVVWCAPISSAYAAATLGATR